jgi:hypothetical protein
MSMRQMVLADLYAGLWVKCANPDCNSLHAVWYRQRTSFVDEGRNWVALCAPCSVENDEYWNDMWSQYYQGCL